MNELSSKQSALVLFSGGQDSATCLAWALSNFARVETLAFNYGQRHHVELEIRRTFLEKISTIHPDWKNRLGSDHLLPLPIISEISQTAMTQDIAIQMQDNGLPNTFVPGRNLMFLTVAGMLAYRRDIQVIVGGMCETDFSGYPDCRDDTINALQVALNLGMQTRLRLETPLMWLTKSETWSMASALGGANLVELIKESTHTCYLGERGQRHPWGYGCATCPACLLRANGYKLWSSDSAQHR